MQADLAVQAVAGCLDDITGNIQKKEKVEYEWNDINTDEKRDKAK